MQHKHETWPLRLDDAGYTMKCAWCGNEFISTRFDAAFCSPKCRLANHRAPQKRANFIEYLSNVGNQVIDGAAMYSRSSDVYEAMLKIQRDVAAALSQFEE